MVKKKRRKKKKQGVLRKIGRFFKNLFIFFVAIGFFSAGGLLLWTASLDIPDFGLLEDRKVAQSTKIYDRTGEILLFDIHKDIKRTIVDFENISTYIKNATVAIEDSEFYEHNGIKPKAILRAIYANLISGGFSQGGSTITQQVIKNTLLTSEKKISRKIKEWLLAVKLEQAMSKEEILELYLNEAPYGGSIYGVEEASRTFFGKESLNVTLAEAAYLAALPQAPTYYSPYGDNKNDLDQRKNRVLKRMLDLGFISEEEYVKAKREEVQFLFNKDTNIKAPHFVMYIRKYLEEKYGEEVISEGGLRVTTTVDYELQQEAEKIVKEYAEENEEKFNATNAGLIAIDPKTGQILVMVGSRDYFDYEHEGNFNITTAYRQPGSAFKPFVYAAAIEKGYTPDTVVFDLKTQFQTTCDAIGNPISGNIDPSECYTPGNYDHLFRGPITLRDALAQSVNVPAIKVLYLAGIENSIGLAERMGIKKLADKNRYGLTLVLGGGEVSLLDITSAYSVFANEGVRNPYQGILKIEDNEGNILEEYSPSSSRVLDKQVALQITDMLSDNIARTPAFGSRSYLYFDGFDVAVKTGTTNDYRDAWIVGYTPSIAVGSWAGNNDNSSMEKKVAGFIVAPMWNAFMQKVLEKYEVEKFKKPEPLPVDTKPIIRGVWLGGETYYTDKISGKLATEYTPPELREEHVIRSVHNILHWVNKNDPLGAAPEYPEADPQYVLWEVPVRTWALQQGIEETDTESIPTEYDDVHKPEFYPEVFITSPSGSKQYAPSDRILVEFSASSTFAIENMDLFVNNRYVGSTKKAPFNLVFTPKEIENIKETNELKVVVYDIARNKKEETVLFHVDMGE